MTKKINIKNNLILFEYLCNLFGVESINDFSDYLKDPALKEYNESNESLYLNEIFNRYPKVIEKIGEDKLREYDHNIYIHTQKINSKRRRQIKWKYFQYVSLLFTEIYLDKYFFNKNHFVRELNEFIKTKNWVEQLEYNIKDLNKIAFWQATGSGKTLTMHVNILQYLHYSKKFKSSFTNIYLITPNEELSNQHQKELELSGIDSALFEKNKTPTLFDKNINVNIIEITKLKEEHGDTTVAVNSLGSENLVLVDEGHRGASGTTWKEMRDQLSKHGFAFEYSATFEQAIPKNNNKLAIEYAKSIIFDYSYKFFYSDGYGKEYQILNILSDQESQYRFNYLTALLLSFYQQQYLFNKYTEELRIFNIEEPLMVFVGSSVNAVRTQNKKKVSDVVDILLFLKKFFEKRDISIQTIDNVLKGNAGLLNRNGEDLFSESFQFIEEDALQIYEHILNLIFNVNSGKGKFHLVNLKGADGEIAMKVGSNDYFGVINVGDTSKLIKLCEKNELHVEENVFQKSLFNNINDSNSSIQILIGSKKFTEGWNSWRVSSMGLMNIGRSEGSQIIQLFGRGVRLKGYKQLLTRSSELHFNLRPENIPEYLSILETLNIFGVRADYMDQFKEYLHREGLPADNVVEIALPVVHNLGKAKLKTIGIKENIEDFRDIESHRYIDLINNISNTQLDLYPKLQALTSYDQDNKKVELNQLKNLETMTDFIDWNYIYIQIQDYKIQNNIYNIQFNREELKEILKLEDIYTVYTPEGIFDIYSYENIQTITEEIILPLLKKMLDKAQKYLRERYESGFRTYIDLDTTDPNFIDEYNFIIEDSQKRIIQKLKEIQKDINLLTVSKEIRNGFELVVFEKHLYKPLVFLDKNLSTKEKNKGKIIKDFEEKISAIKVSPVQLNKGERDFVESLKEYWNNSKTKLNDIDIYLLRNHSKGKGIGFFEANNFYPDFILWILQEGNQYIRFIDPKGIRNLSNLSDPKIQLSKNIKNIQRDLHDKNVYLDSYILSNTKKDSEWWGKNISLQDFHKLNVLFMEEEDYLKELLTIDL